MEFVPLNCSHNGRDCDFDVVRGEFADGEKGVFEMKRLKFESWLEVSRMGLDERNRSHKVMGKVRLVMRAATLGPALGNDAIT